MGAECRVAASRPSETLLVAGREIAISHPDKVLFPQLGYTKLDLVRYYLSVSAGALRGAGGRPNMLVRYPDGIEGQHFYQKRAPRAGLPGSRSRTSIFRPDARRKRSCHAMPRHSPGSPTSPASSCILIPYVPRIWSIPTSCGSTSIPSRALPGSRYRRSLPSPARYSRVQAGRLAQDLRLAWHAHPGTP